ETEEVMNEFDMILNNRIDLSERDLANWKSNGRSTKLLCLLDNTRFTLLFAFLVSKDVDIGELASLTETNNVIDCNTSAEIRKTWSQKYILKFVYRYLT